MKLPYLFIMLFIFVLSSCGEDSNSLGGNTESGSSGSLANMQIQDGKLHILSNQYIRSFSLDEPLNPKKIGSTWHSGAETLFAYQEQYLIAGTSTGVDFYQIPDGSNDHYALKRLSQFSHIKAYDPVIAFDGKAYFTTRDGLTTQGGGDLLALLDISSIDEPIEIAEYRALDEPIGLSLRGEILYVCDKVTGLNLFRVKPESEFSNNNNMPYTFVPQELNGFVACNDVIATDDQIIITSEQGVVQLRIESGLLDELSILEAL